MRKEIFHREGKDPADFSETVKDSAHQDQVSVITTIQWFLKMRESFVFINKHVHSNLIVFISILKDKVRMLSYFKNVSLPRSVAMKKMEEHA